MAPPTAGKERNGNRGIIICLIGAVPVTAICTWLVMAGTVLGQVKEIPEIKKAHKRDTEMLNAKAQALEVISATILAELRALKESVDRIERNISRGDG